MHTRQLMFFFLLSLLVVAFTSTSGKLKTPRAWGVAIFVWMAVSVGLVAVTFGLGFYWDAKSLAGTLLAHIAGLGCMLLCSQLPVVALRRYKISKAWLVLSSLLGLAVGIPLGIIVGLTLGCKLTGNCL